MHNMHVRMCAMQPMLELKRLSLSLNLPVGLTKQEAQLTPSQKYLAIRYVTQVCFNESDDEK